MSGNIYNPEGERSEARRLPPPPLTPSATLPSRFFPAKLHFLSFISQARSFLRPPPLIWTNQHVSRELAFQSVGLWLPPRGHRPSRSAAGHPARLCPSGGPGGPGAEGRAPLPAAGQDSGSSLLNRCLKHLDGTSLEELSRWR